MNVYTVEALVKGLTRPEFDHVKLAGNQIAQPVLRGYELPRFYRNTGGDWSDYSIGMLVSPDGTTYTVILNNSIVHQRMTVSEDFKRVQCLDLVVKTNSWMREFFGVWYPVYVFESPIGNRIELHQTAFEELQDRLDGRLL